MTKPLPTGCIKKEKTPKLKTVVLGNPVGDLFVFDTHFVHKRASAKQVLYNEVLPLIIRKHKIIDPSGRSVYQLVEQYSETDKGIPCSYRAIQKAHATLLFKRFQLLYLDHLRILIFRAGWVVAKIYSHFSFERERLKRNFMLVNQRSRQTAKNSVEKDFFKLLKNANFGSNCRCNLDNCKFVLIFDELNEISYNVFHKNISNLYRLSCSKEN